MNHVKTYSLFTDFDIYLFKSGKHYRLYEKFGAHPATVDGVEGMYFSVWAPTANRVSVVGDFNYWNDSEHVLNVRWDSSGIWEGFIPHVKSGEVYKYKIHSNNNGIVTEKCDPYGYHTEHPPKTASVTYDLEGYEWQDGDWMNYRKEKNDLDKPYAVYEVHFESWMKNVEDDRSLSYWEASTALVKYVKEMNFTHVEFMPIMEYPFDQSWGYQLTGYFAPSCRFGHPKEFMNLIDEFHKNDIGVILDWVPSHFPSDAHGLGFFDGSHLYEHPDKKKGYHKDWKSLIFNYERNEIRSFLISNACFWLDKYHIDGLRVDAVASMLYLDYSREDGEWEPNEFGGNENLAAVSFLKDFNTEVYQSFPGVQTIAEESTAFPGVTRNVEHGGLGFGMKWMMGWMHDTLGYFKKDPIYRRHHHNEITFSMAYAFTERYMLPLSHDEVVYGKGSIITRMPGDKWQKLANLRLLYGYMYSHPGGNLLFMGAEFGQENEWSYAKSLDWHLLEDKGHKGVQTYMKDLNTFLKDTPALYEKSFSQEGFEWINHEDGEKSVLSYIRKGHDPKNDIVVVCNNTPTPQENYLIGVHRKGKLKEVFNSDLKKYGGSGIKNGKKISISDKPWNWKDYSAEVNLPPLSITIFKIE
ncbi:1,4-alpha-glucan branching protein GlgB [Wenyingzhuangia aestuarii]|uniref:1,4-alpha-glucan branching protein GlgB n=1 Tax=Wenyingzhuangia aestuarii TaxID=1647582 RepID=UPI001438CF50|nr:1,4-alpha-glucan branching protein GlgB [Wenyingzhuangia aestuarii]NJB81607.1 1,4-alpha-glucan branching enzyme [Wenyingzhuangia aestuarii]